MSAASRQLVFDLGHRPALGAEDFLVGGSNAGAIGIVDSWPDWPTPAALVVGPERSGKTHLAHVWQLRSGAAIVTARDIANRTIAEFDRSRALAIEDLDHGIGCERTMFHLLNMAREQQGSLLLTSARPAGDIAVSLPDLRSRLRAAVMVEIAPPDDGLLSAVLVKHFADRQLTVEPNVIAYLVAHMERTMATAQRVVATIDVMALRAKRKVSRALAAEALVELASEP